MSDHAKIRAEVAPLTDALTNCITELELIPLEQRRRVMRALNALFPGHDTTDPLALYRGALQQGGSISSGGITYGQGPLR